MATTKIEKFQNELKRRGLFAYIVPSNDPHFGEYIQDYYKCREWISGFDGSAGTVVITEAEAALWTDSRYFIQANEQLSGSGIVLKKLKVPGEESIVEWLQGRYSQGRRVGLDSALISYSEYETLKTALNPFELVLTDDIFESVWSDRPSRIKNQIFVYGTEFSGESTKSKICHLKELLGHKQNFAYIITSCDESAWLCNVRGSDVDYNPLPMLYSIVYEDKVELFCNIEGVSRQDADYLKMAGVELKEYEEFSKTIENLQPSLRRVAVLSKLSARDYKKLTSKGCEIIPDLKPGGSVSFLKAVKNNIEIKGFREAHKLDGIAWVKYLMYVEKCLNEGVAIREDELAEQMIKFRKETSSYMGESFEPIVAYGQNGALPHYSPYKNPIKIDGEGVLLTDTGAHYKCGTTDTTRTICVGTPDIEVMKDYTAVLRGMINLSIAHFPAGTRGSQLDFLARGEVCGAGKLYMHGTGHGVGHFLPVHEGPQSIRMEENPVVLVPGMVQSCEPAIYVEGKYGIRIENLLLCKEEYENRYAKFLGFETLTLVPIDKRLIDISLLDLRHINWINNYHKRVYSELSPILTEEERAWLSERTSALN